MPVSIGPRIGVEGVKAFRQAFLEITAEAKRFDAEMQRITASFDKNDSAMTRNRKVREQLTKQIEHQKGVVKAASDTYDEAVKAETASAERYEKVQENVQKQLQRLAEEKKKLESAANKELAAYERQQKYVALLEENYKGSEANVKSYADALGKSHPFVKRLTEELGEQKKELDDENKKLDEHAKALSKARRAVEENEEAQAKQTMRVGDASNTLYRASARVDQYAIDLEKAKVKQAELNEELRKVPTNLDEFAKRLNGVGDLAIGVGGKLTKYVTTPLAALGTLSIKSASDIADGMAKIYTIATEGQEPMSQMRQELMELSDASGFAMDDLTEAAYQAISASVKTEKTAEFLNTATKLARGGFTSTTQAVNLLTTAINAYGYEAEDASHISDILLKTQNDGKTIIDELAQSMGVVIPTAAAYNVSLEQLAAAYATMTKQGVTTSRATTFINALFTELENSSKDVAKVLESETGRSFAQLMDQGWSLGDVLKVLYEHADQDSEAFANLFKNVRSGRAANALMAEDLGVLNYEIERMGNAAGQTDYAIEQLQTPSLQAKKALNKLKNSAVDLGETMISEFYPAFEKGVEIIDDLRKWIKELSNEQKESIVKMLAFAAATGPVIKGIGGVMSGIAGALDSFSKMKKAASGASTGLKALGAITADAELGFTALVPALTVGIGAFMALGAAAKISNDEYRKSVTETYKLADAEKEMAESAHGMKARFDEMSKASKEQTDSIEKNANTAYVLVGRYNALVESTGLATKEQQALADIYLGQLADVLGKEKEDIQALVDENGKLSEAIEDVIEKKRANAMLSAYEDRYTEALANRTQAQKIAVELAQKEEQASSDLAKAKDNLTHWQEKYAEETANGTRATDETTRALNEAVIAHGAANAAYQEIKTGLDEANEALLNYNTTITNFEELSVALMTGSAEEINLALDKITSGFITAANGTQESLEKQKEDSKAAWVEIKRLWGKGAAGVTKGQLDAAEALYLAASAELDKYVGLNDSESDRAQAAVENNIQYHQKPLTNKTKEMYNSMNEEVAAGMNRAVERVNSGGGGMVNVMHQKISPMKTEAGLLKGAILDEFNAQTLYDKLYSVGSYFIQGLVNGMKSVDVTRTAREISTDAVHASKHVLVINSPSKVMEEIGRYYTLGFAKGISGESNEASLAAEMMAKEAIDSSYMLNHYPLSGPGFSAVGSTTNTRNISAPINVSVSVNGNVDNVDQLAETIAEKINDQIIRRNEVFA